MAGSSPALQHWTIDTPEVTRWNAVYLTVSTFFATCSLFDTDLACALSAGAAFATTLVGVGDTPDTATGEATGDEAHAAAEKAPTIKEAISLFMKVSFGLLNSSSCLEFIYNEFRRRPVDPNI